MVHAKIQAPLLSVYKTDYPLYLQHYKLYVDAVTAAKSDWKKALQKSSSDGKNGVKPVPVSPDDSVLRARRERRAHKRRERRKRVAIRNLQQSRVISSLVADVTRNNGQIAKSLATTKNALPESNTGWTLVQRKKSYAKVANSGGKGKGKDSSGPSSIKILSISEDRDSRDYRAAKANLDDPWIQWSRKKRQFLKDWEDPKTMALITGGKAAWDQWKLENPEPERFLVFDMESGCMVPFINGWDDMPKS